MESILSDTSALVKNIPEEDDVDNDDVDLEDMVEVSIPEVILKNENQDLALYSFI